MTKVEQRLLRYPPTEQTWECRHRKADKTLCGQAMSGSATECFLCKTKKPRQPKLLWPAYVRACGKAGIEPGTRWPPKPEAPPEADDKPRLKTRRKGRMK